MSNGTEGEGYTAINLPDAMISDMMYRLAHGIELTEEQKAELLAAMIRETGATAPGPPTPRRTGT